MDVTLAEYIFDKRESMIVTSCYLCATQRSFGLNISESVNPPSSSSQGADPRRVLARLLSRLFAFPHAGCKCRFYFHASFITRAHACHLRHRLVLLRHHCSAYAFEDAGQRRGKQRRLCAFLNSTF